MFVLGLRRREQGNLPLEDHSTALLNLCLSKHGADGLGKEIKRMGVRWMKNSNTRGLLLSSPGMSPRARISAPRAWEEAKCSIVRTRCIPRGKWGHFQGTFLLTECDRSLTALRWQKVAVICAQDTEAQRREACCPHFPAGRTKPVFSRQRGSSPPRGPPSPNLVLSSVAVPGDSHSKYHRAGTPPAGV